ncbi:Rib/alpha-like domain-containing protein, partial [uncultured Ligilactobacillus sp.]
MLSKKNHYLQAQKFEAKQQHFAIKRLTVGVASVLISSTFAMYAGLHNAMAAETTSPQADTASETTTSGNETAKQEVVLSSPKQSERKMTSPTPVSEDLNNKNVTMAEENKTNDSSALATDKNSSTSSEHEDKVQKVATEDTSKEGERSSVTPNSSSANSAKQTETSREQTSTEKTPVATVDGTNSQAKAPKADLVVATPVPSSGEETTETVEQSSKEVSSQWQADASKALANKSGLYTPQLSYNRKWYSMTINPAMLTPEVMKGNAIPFTATIHRSTMTTISSPAYKLRLQLDARLADKVAQVSLSPEDHPNETVNFTQVKENNGAFTNIWEANVVYGRDGLFDGGVMDSGKPVVAKNGKIMLKDTLENVYPKLANIATEPLGYNGYVYDDSSKTALLATNNEGYVVGPNDPLVKVPVTSTEESKFIGAHSNVNYDPSVGKNGALVVYYQAQKSAMWSYSNDWQFQFHYTVDPNLLPYLEKKEDGAYTVELDKGVAGLGTADGSYGFEAITNNLINNIYKPLTYHSKLMQKVADLPLNLDGTGTLNPTNLNDFVQFNNTLLVGGRPVMVRLVYHLNKKLNDIYTEMLKKGTTGNNLLFSHYYSDPTGRMQKYSLATSVLSFNDSDGDTLPNLKEDSDSTDPYVSTPNVSNVYGDEKKVHGQLVFSNVEKNPQVVTVTDDKGNVLGKTEVTPTPFGSLAKAFPFDVTLNDQTLTADKEVTVRVSSKLGKSEDTVENSVPQRTVLQVKTGPVAVKDLKYPLNAVFLQEPKELIANHDVLPADATYSFVKKPDLSTKGTKDAVVKVSFLDKFDPNYRHEIEVKVPVKVEGVDLKDGQFTLKPLVMHVNEVNDDLRPLSLEELQSWHENDNSKVLSGQALRSLVKSITWSQSPSTKRVGQARGVVTVTTKDDKTMLADVPVNIVGATAKVDLTTPWGTPVAAKDALVDTDALAQFDKDGSPVEYAWKEPLDVTPTANADHVVHNTVVVTYGDKTKQDVPVVLTVGHSQASDFNVALAQVKVHYGQTVDPEVSLTKEQKAQFKVSQVTLDRPVMTTNLGNSTATVRVVFNDGSTTLVEMPVLVVGATAKTDVTTAWNVLPDPENLVNDTATLAQYAPTYTWAQRPNVTPAKEEAHEVFGTVDVTYPDKVVQPLPVVLTVSNSQATVFEKAPDKHLLPVVVNYGSVAPDAMAALTSEDKTRFDVTKVTFTTPVDTMVEGTKDVLATLTFADTSTTSLPVKVEVLGAKVKDNVETAWGKVPAAETTVSNVEQLKRFGTDYSWEKAPNVTPDAKGSHQETGTLLVTYQNGATQTVPVVVTVKKSDSEKFATAQVVLHPMTVNYGAKVTAREADKALTAEEKTNLKVTALSFKQEVVTSTTGERSYPVQLDFSDGSVLNSQVQVQVLGALAKSDLKTPWGTKVNAEDLVANVAELNRFGTSDHPVTYRWLAEPDVDPKEDQDHTVRGVVMVTYGDNATQQLPASFVVEPSDAERSANVLQGARTPLTVNYGAQVVAEQALGDFSAEAQKQAKLSAARFNEPVLTTELGTNNHLATLTFADGSTSVMELPVKVVGAQVVQGSKTPWGTLPDPSTVVTDLTELARFTPKYTWKVQPLVTPTATQDHHVKGELQVEFADGATQSVPVELDVAPSMAEKATKDLQTQLVTEDLKAVVPATDAQKGLTEEAKQAYSVTKVLFDLPVETNEVGEKDYEATVSFADGSNTKVLLQVRVVSQAEKYAPTVKAGLHVAVDDKLASSEVLDPTVVLPKGTQVAWKTAVDTSKAGQQTGELEVTYPDGTKDTLPVSVKVGTDAEAVTPTLKPELKVKLGEKLDPAEVLDPSVKLPKGTQVAWKTAVDTSKAGQQTGELEVTYPDGTKDTLPVPVKVGTDAEAVTPMLKPELKVKLGEKLDPTEMLASEVVLPKGTQVAWKTAVDTNKAGQQTGELEVTYPDGTKDTLPVPVKVGTDAEAVTPTLKPELKAKVGEKLDPTEMLASEVVLPKGTQVTWKTPVDTNKAGQQTGELEVTYPDGTKDTLPVSVKVGTDAEAVTPTLKPELKAKVGEKLDRAEVLDPSVKLPKGTQVAWKTAVDTNKAGQQAGELEVTYPDGTKDTLPVSVKVGTDAEAVTPTL